MKDYPGKAGTAIYYMAKEIHIGKVYNVPFPAQYTDDVPDGPGTLILSENGKWTWEQIEEYSDGFSIASYSMSDEKNISLRLNFVEK